MKRGFEVFAWGCHAANNKMDLYLFIYLFNQHAYHEYKACNLMLLLGPAA